MLLQAYRRNESATVDLYGLKLQFAPNVAGHVVCEVEDERAIERLLSITEAYRRYDPSQPVIEEPVLITAAAPPVQEVNTDPDVDDEENAAFTADLLGSEDLPADYEIGDKRYSQADVIELAFQRSRLTREAWNLNDADDREGLIEQEVVHLIAAADKAREEAAAATFNPLVISNGTDTIDLGTYAEPKLRAFAKDNGIALPGGKSTKVGDLRLMVAKALTGA